MEPADGATTRKNRILDMLRYVQTNEPSGLSHQEIVGYLDMSHGLKPRTGGGYVQRMISLGILRPRGQKLHLDESGFQRWLEVSGMGTPAVMVRCTKCKAEYISSITACPTCQSVERSLVKRKRRPTK